MPEDLRDTAVLSEHTPEIICSWIKFYCGKPESPLPVNGDVVNIDLTPARAPNKWSSASIMRAAATYYYVVQLGNPPSPFTRNSAGNWVGNPTRSEFLRRYMRSLRRQKV